MTAPSAEWHDFFVAQAGASAALAGLMFVALSINIERILKSPWLPPRAGSTMVLLIGSVIQALVALWPAPALWVTGAEELFVSAVIWLYASWLVFTGARTPKEFGGSFNVVLTTQVVCLPAIAGSIALVYGLEGGFYAIAFAALMAIVGGILNSWVLLVEILR
jgi:hypothetical protein